MKTIATSFGVLLVLTLVFVGYKSSQDPAKTTLANVDTAITESNTIASNLPADSNSDTSELAGVAAALGSGKTTASGSTTASTTLRVQEARHLLNAFQGVMGQLHYKLQNQ